MIARYVGKLNATGITYRIREHNTPTKKIESHEKCKANTKTKGILRRGRIQITQEVHVLLADEEQMTAARTKQYGEEKHSAIRTEK